MLKLGAALLLTCALLTGCGNPARYASTNPSSNEKLQAVQVAYQLARPTNIGLYVMKNAPEREKAVLLRQVKEDAYLLGGELANRVPVQLMDAFKKRGIRGGRDETVFIKAVSAMGSATRHDIMINLEISVKTSDRTKPLWVAQISESSAADDLAGEKMSAKLSGRILSELAKAGFIPSE
jgi:hypothetical protein